MRRGLGLVLLSLLLLGACNDEGRTRIILEDFENAHITNSVFVTISTEFFVPSYEINQTLSTTEIPSGAVQDVVLLDVAESQSAGRYYIYIFEDTDISGDATTGDEFFPVISISPEEGESYSLKGLTNSGEYTEGLVPDNRSFFYFDYKLNVDPTPLSPLVLLIQLTTDFTPVAPDISFVITDSALLNGHCFFLPSNTYSYLAFLDADNDRYPDIGEFASTDDVNTVADNFTPFAGDEDIFVGMNGTVITAN